LLTDGQVLIAGGVDSNGETLATADLWDTQDNSASQLEVFTTGRRNHSATLMPDGRVLLWGGSDEKGAALTSGEVFDPESERFTPVDAYPAAEFPRAAEPPILMASVPEHGSDNVPTDSIIALRLSKPLKFETVDAGTVTLSGPNGVEGVRVVTAENGSLVFVTPDTELLPGATYTITINGAVDREGLLLPVSGITFSTLGSATAAQPLVQGRSALGSGRSVSETPDTEINAMGDDWEWKGKRVNGKPHSDWQDLPPLMATPGITALSGQVLDLRGRPLANVVLKAEGHDGGETRTARTDDTGRFLIQDAATGWNELIIDGRGGHNPKSKIDNA
jgi:hypothetical protein